LSWEESSCKEKPTILLQLTFIMTTVYITIIFQTNLYAGYNAHSWKIVCCSAKTHPASSLPWPTMKICSDLKNMLLFAFWLYNGYLLFNALDQV
jgi:hypothetical protein